MSYDALAVSTARLSSGLRINTAADDAAGLAVRETMRADIAVLNQGVRNAGDAISLIQTAEGALSVIDEKLIRMKELAEQASTGTYTTTQRAIMDSEYQAMAAEIDRIAAATDFNGVKLLNGEITQTNSSGLKIHFGTGNESTEDYYYINIGDMRATATGGLEVGGGATAEVITASAAYTYTSAGLSGGYFAFQYDAGGDGANNANDLAGIYNLASGLSYGLTDLVTQINEGTAARIFMDVTSTVGTLASGDVLFTLDDVQFIALTSDQSAAAPSWATGSYIAISTTAVSAQDTAAFQALIITYWNSAGNNPDIYAISGSGDGNIMFLAKNAGAAGNNFQAIENFSYATFQSTTFSDHTENTTVNMSGGGNTWATASTVQSNTDNLYHLRLTGSDRGENYDLTVITPSTQVAGLGSLDGGDYVAAAWDTTTESSGSGNWNGADILTQTAAQEALAQIDSAIASKDNTRASLGATANRLENTIT